MAEKHLLALVLDHTIVRPGGLKSDAPAGPLYVRCFLGGKRGKGARGCSIERERLVAEKRLRASGLDYTIVRPGNSHVAR
jgi:hypothetical protein